MNADLIPRAMLFGSPERTNPQLSPDGRYLAYIAPDERNVQQVWLRTVRRADDRALTGDKKRGIRVHCWAYDGEHLIYQQDSDGDENWHLFAINIQSGLIRDLTPFHGIQARMVARDPSVPHEVLVRMNLNDRRRHDVYRVDLRSGAVELDAENPGGVIAWTADAELCVRAMLAIASDGGFDLTVRQAAARPWRTVRHWGPDDQGHAVGFSRDGTILYVVGSHGANTMRLLALEVATGSETVLAEDPQYDLDDDPWYHRTGVFFHPTERMVQAAGFYRDKLEWQVLDDSITADFEAIADIGEGEFRITSRDLADRAWLVSYTSDDGSLSYYAHDRGTRSAAMLFSQRPDLDGLPLANKRSISFAARDGLAIHGYLTLPVGVSPSDLPTVLLVHGGPNTRDTWGFDSEVQWLANRGYAVLQVNYRGSTGYGKAFRNAGNREWGGKMHQDLIDGVQWIVSQGVADLRRIAIMGFSYGGYATLAGLAFAPDVFAAGVALCGGSNLITWLRSDPPCSEAEKALCAQRIGDSETEEEFLKSRSPFFFADCIQAPLLIAQGANDRRVKQSEGDQIVAAMREAGQPVEYVIYTDEGHGLARPQNRLHFYARAEAFLARHLGGQREPLAEISGHSGVEY